MIFFFNHITNFRDGCPMWLFKVLLPSLVLVICTSPVSWDSLILPATAAVKTCFTCKKIKTSDPPQELFVPFIFCSFKHRRSNTVVVSVVQTPFSLIFLRPSLLPKIQRGFKITFSKTVEECQVLSCWIVSESSVEDFRRSVFWGKALLTVSMVPMFWFQFLRHLVEWIFHSIWWVGRFYRS